MRDPEALLDLSDPHTDIRKLSHQILPLSTKTRMW